MAAKSDIMARWHIDVATTDANPASAAAFARLLYSEFYRARREAEEALAAARVPSDRPAPKPDTDQVLRRKQELEAELAVLNAKLDLP